VGHVDPRLTAVRGARPAIGSHGPADLFIQEEHGELVVGRAMGQLLPGVSGIAALPYLAAPAHTEPDLFVDEVQVEYAGGAVRRVLPSGAAVGGAVETPVHVTAGHQVVVLPEAPRCP